MRHGGATRQTEIEANALTRARIKFVARRWRLFDGTASPVAADALRGLLGQPPMASGVLWHTIQVLLRDTPVCGVTSISPRRCSRSPSKAVCSTLTATLHCPRWPWPSTGRSVHHQDAHRLEPGTWRAQLEPGAIRAGANEVTVFLVSRDGRHLQLAYPTGQRPPSLVLASDTASTFWSVRATERAVLAAERLRAVPMDRT